MSFRDHADELRNHREAELLEAAAERAEMYAAYARMVADTEAAIRRSRPSTQQALRENLEVQEDYTRERTEGWALDRWEWPV